ncbi:hypothetical protein LSUE1_G005721 [Lachnellula suecica]|uniref:Acyltransferase 3 domain-containing protein n=1 Tax=Lachnellula suecica TaxID=602035 RepID=A0A8T9CDV1_9HELO|nr:hypothetical protein LSUE1_G005721 [Lachnellula suecica]
MGVKQENVKWLDHIDASSQGLRGIASVLVVITHINRAFNEQLFLPTTEEGAAPQFLQYPIVRVFVQGRTTIPIFSLVTGYVCALKPIRQFLAGDQDKALTGITKSAFRRIPRLVLPSWLATIIIWTFTELGGFLLTKHVSSFWLIYTSPNQLPIGTAIMKLLRTMGSTFTTGVNDYDGHQWTLLPLLKGAYLVFSMLYATAYMKSRYRMMAELAMVGYFWAANDRKPAIKASALYTDLSPATFGVLFSFGAFLAEISQTPTHVEWLSTHKWPGRFLSPFLLILGLLSASFPEDHAEWVLWSNFMLKLSDYMLLPENGNVPTFYSGLGVILIASSIHFSKPLKTVLSLKYFLWAGKNSFAVYLIHGTLIRSVLSWMMFGVINPTSTFNEDGTETMGPNLERPHNLRWYLWLPIWFAGLYWLANLWTNYVDPACAKITAALERKMFEQDDGMNIPLSSIPVSRVPDPVAPLSSEPLLPQ